MSTSSYQHASEACTTESERDALRWKIRNARYQSTFLTNGSPNTQDYRAHFDIMKESFRGGRASSPTANFDYTGVVDIQFKQAFNNIERLIREYEEFLQSASPLDEEDILFLLLKRYSQSSGSSVYMEIKRPGEVQIYDSSIAEPPNVLIVGEHIAHASGVTNAEFNLLSPQDTSLDQEPEPFLYVPIPQSPSTVFSECSVIINFPEMLLLSSIQDDDAVVVSEDPPAYSGSEPHDHEVTIHDWAQLPEKFQPPSFCVHRCHHDGVEHGSEDEAFELPFGFPEVIHHLHLLPPNFYYTGLFVHNQAIHSEPHIEGGLQAFECQMLPSKTKVYILVERQGHSLAYSCFSHEEVG
ncbi:hypothetical protein A1F96_10208 [Pyrenophora tritici-repentis]|uniref:Uncharacterized protein n=1 Tax=Pyrenophora tritici-repentis TaxID=45151 RepID=A0A922NF59_9PLEO|nr:hypothetical protein Ptr86124_006098 [Pyrenophora tritici-repentis]KAI1677154.1 hypothetical protein KJE20_13243 [Pyrenophora tritici-repentis]PZD23480.1 hypothetical protein A1F96_10208 [Pyrenophora tritici-repentis]